MPTESRRQSRTIWLPPPALRLPLHLNNRLGAAQVRGDFYSGQGPAEVWWKGEVRVKEFLEALAYVEECCRMQCLPFDWCRYVRRQLGTQEPAANLTREEWRRQVREATLAGDTEGLRAVVEEGRVRGWAL